MTNSEVDLHHMRRACELAVRGEGYVEPNPMVGCVIARGDRVLSEGWHRAYGNAHAEVDALSALPPNERGALGDATMYVTLEPCCHVGKTPPCTKAIMECGVARVVVAVVDPFPQVQGQGVTALRQAGVRVETGLCADESLEVLGPYLKLVEKGTPWVLAKWAMTLDGKIASRAGQSQWISSSFSRDVVHRIRGRVDGILVGIETALADDPSLTARPAGTRLATRIVVDSRGRLPNDCQLTKTAQQIPLLIAVGPEAAPDDVARLTQTGAEVTQSTIRDPNTRLNELLMELGRRRMTNLLVEGGGRVLGSLFDLNQIDEVHTFIAPKLIGGEDASNPMAGNGLAEMANARKLKRTSVHLIDEDIYVHGRIKH